MASPIDKFVLGHASRASKDAAADMPGALDEHVELRHPV
jgi:hypothetical protein